MGGRGSEFKQVLEVSSEKNLDLGDYSKDKETTKQNNLTKSLKRYNIIVCESTDSMDEALLNSNLQQIEKLSNKYSVLLSKEPEQELHIRNFKIKDDNVLACFSRTEPLFTELQICYNKHKVKDVQSMNDVIKTNIQRGFNASAENKTDYVITHEFGHYLERNIIEKRFQQDIQQFVKFKNDYKNSKQKVNEEADKIYYEISEIAKTKYRNTSLGVSDYSLQENSREWFAEVFASAFTNSSYKPPLARAMIDFLKKEMREYDNR